MIRISYWVDLSMHIALSYLPVTYYFYCYLSVSKLNNPLLFYDNITDSIPYS